MGIQFAGHSMSPSSCWIIEPEGGLGTALNSAAVSEVTGSCGLRCSLWHRSPVWVFFFFNFMSSFYVLNTHRLPILYVAIVFLCLSHSVAFWEMCTVISPPPKLKYGTFWTTPKCFKMTSTQAPSNHHSVFCHCCFAFSRMEYKQVLHYIVVPS